MGADFTPTLGVYNTIRPFRFWCQKVLPLVYDDSLSYYEMLCKVKDYLNKLIEDVATAEGNIQELDEAYAQLEEYVNTYFENLDVQSNIDTKLDDMAESGELGRVIANALVGILSPSMFGAVGDGIHDDTTAFTSLANACTDKTAVIIPEGTYNLTEDVFCNANIINDGGTYPNKHLITPNKKDVFFAQSNMLNTNIVDINEGYSVQALCYNSVDDVYYLGTTSADDNTQVIITLNNRLQKVTEATLNVPSLHLNTLTYDSQRGRLITIKSGGHELLLVDLVNQTTSTLANLPDFNSGMVYDEALDLFVGVNGPAISGSREWNFRVYDSSWNIIHSGTFINPYGYTTGETPNGYSVYNGLMVHSAFTTSGVQYGIVTRTQFIFSCDMFGNVSRVFQEYFNTREMEGIAYNGKQYITAAVLCSGKAMLTLIDPDGVFSDVINNINQRCELPIAWDDTYVEQLRGHFNINSRERKIECCGFIQLKTGLPTNTELVLGTIPYDFTPWGTNAVIPTANGLGLATLVVVRQELRCVLGTGAGRYLNLGGYWYY